MRAGGGSRRIANSVCGGRWFVHQSGVDDTESIAHLCGVIREHDQLALVWHVEAKLVHGEDQIRYEKEAGAHRRVDLSPGDVSLESEAGQCPPENHPQEN